MHILSNNAFRNFNLFTSRKCFYSHWSQAAEISRFFLNYFHFFHTPSKLAIPVTFKKDNQKGDHSNKELSITKDTLGPKNIVRNCFYLDSYLTHCDIQ